MPPSLSLHVPSPGHLLLQVFLTLGQQENDTLSDGDIDIEAGMLAIHNGRAATGKLSVFSCSVGFTFKSMPVQFPAFHGPEILPRRCVRNQA